MKKMKNVIKNVITIGAVTFAIATIVFSFCSIQWPDNPLIDALFKVSITLNATFNLSFAFSINYTSIVNSFNSNSPDSSEGIRKIFELCYFIHDDVLAMIELLDNPKGKKIEKCINDRLAKTNKAYLEIKAKIASYNGDDSITLEEIKRLSSVEEYVVLVGGLMNYRPFRWVSIKSIEDKNAEFKQLLISLSDKFRLIFNKENHKEGV